MSLLSLVTSVTVILLMYGLSVAVDSVFMQGLPLSLFDSALLLLTSAIIIRGIVFWISAFVVQSTASKIKVTIRDRLFRKIQVLGPSWTERQNSGELASTAVEGVEKLDAYYSRFVPAAIHMAIVPIVLALFVFSIDWLSGLILIITGPLIPVFMSLIGMKAQSQTQKQWSTLRFLSAHFLDAIQGIRTLKLFSQVRQKHADVVRISDRFRQSTLGILKIAFLSGFVLELFASLATALVAVEIGVRLIEGHIDFQLGLFVLLLAPEYYLPFRMFGAQHHAGMDGSEAAGRIFEILDTSNIKVVQNSEINISSVQFETDPDRTDPVCDVPDPPYHIRFTGLSYTYPGNMSSTLSKCSFDLFPGVTTALAGLSGSGKSTITKLLSRQILPDEGQILVNEIPHTHFDEFEWLGKIGLVNQSTWLFDGTILSNLLAARPEASSEEVVEAAAAAGAHDFISRLPQGYSTKTGELGVRFSGGERQRISIARAFLKDAPILILDEPSSALDPESESIINKALKKLLQNRTVLVIAHRLSTVRQADRILLLENGQISALGKHIELLANCNSYQQMVKSYS